MKKLLSVMMLSIAIAGIAFAAKYETVTVSGAAASTTVSLTNTASIATYQIVDVYIGMASAPTADSAVVLTQNAGGGSVFVESSTISSNATGTAIALANKVVQHDIGNIVTLTRPATATNGAWRATFNLLKDPQ